MFLGPLSLISQTLLHQRPFDSPYSCPHMKNLPSLARIFFLQLVAFRNRTWPRNVHMSRVSAMLTKERGNDPLSRLRHEAAVDHHDVNCLEGKPALARKREEKAEHTAHIHEDSME